MDVSTSTETPTPEPGQKQPNLKEVEALYCNVAGVKYRPQDVIEELKTGSQVRLEWEPTNEYDPLAIKVLDTQDRLCGYIPKKNTWILHTLRKAGIKLLTRLTVNPFAREDQKLMIKVYFYGDEKRSF